MFCFYRCVTGSRAWFLAQRGCWLSVVWGLSQVIAMTWKHALLRSLSALVPPKQFANKRCVMKSFQSEWYDSKHADVICSLLQKGNTQRDVSIIIVSEIIQSSLSILKNVFVTIVRQKPQFNEAGFCVFFALNVGTPKPTAGARSFLLLASSGGVEKKGWFHWNWSVTSQSPLTVHDTEQHYHGYGNMTTRCTVPINKPLGACGKVTKGKPGLVVSMHSLRWANLAEQKRKQNGRTKADYSSDKTKSCFIGDTLVLLLQMELLWRSARNAGCAALHMALDIKEGLFQVHIALRKVVGSNSLGMYRRYSSQLHRFRINPETRTDMKRNVLINHSKMRVPHKFIICKSETEVAAWVMNGKLLRNILI